MKEDYEPVLPDDSLASSAVNDLDRDRDRDRDHAEEDSTSHSSMDSRRRSVNRGNDSDAELESGLGGSPEEDEAEAKKRRLVLADQLWSPLRKLIAEPKRSAYWYLVINSVFISVGEIHRFLIYMLTFPVFLALYAFLIYRLICFVARALVYPGCISSVLRGIERDCSKEILRQYTVTLEAYEDLINFLLVVAQRQSGTRHNNLLNRELVTKMASVDAAHKSLTIPLAQALRLCKDKSGELAQRGELVLKNVTAIELAMEDFKAHFWTKLMSRNGGQDVGSTLKELLKELTVPKSFAQNSDVVVKVEGTEDSSADAAGAYIRLSEAVRTMKENLVYMEEPKTEEAGEEEPAVAETKCSCGHSHGDAEPGFFRHKGFIANVKWAVKEYRSSLKPLQAVPSIDYFRADLQIKFGARQVWVKGAGGVELDAMFLPADKPYEDNRTVIVCNPNAAVYEFASLQCHWANFYTKRGINVLMYNYRGYGRSSGRPDPAKLKADGVHLIQYLVEKEGVQRGWIGLHGESIGGVVACHLGATSDAVSLLIADRTFQSLPSAAEHLIAKWASKALRTCLRWEASNVNNLLTASAKNIYTVCTCDPDDTIIVNAASLKVGVARKVLDLAVAGPILSDDPDTVNEELVKRVIGRGFESLEWARSASSVNKFAKNLHKLVSTLRALLIVQHQQQGHFHEYENESPDDDTPLRPTTFVPELVEPLTNAMNIIMFLDGCCGEYLGKAYAAQRRDYPQTFEENEGDVAADEESTPFKDWIACYLVWCNRKIQPRDRQNGSNNSLDEWELCGFRGSFGPAKFIPLPSGLPPLRRFAAQYRQQLSTVECAGAFDEVLDILGRLDAFAQEPVEGEPLHLSLHSLSCGHNGTMSTAEQADLVEHLKRAKWIPR